MKGKLRILALLLGTLVFSCGALSACTETPPTPSGDQGGTQTPSDETPGGETPGDETPGDETPGDETPGDETPGDETPGDETPGDETPDPLPPAPEALVLSHESGVYTNAFTLAVSAEDSDHAIYYTTDGSIPTTQSTRYTSSGISIVDDSQTREYPLTAGVAYGNPHDYGNYTYGTGNSCTVLHFLEVDGEGNTVATKSASYFIRSEGRSEFPLPVISISLPLEDALSFYNDIQNESKERAEMEYFDFVSGERFALNTQIKLGGNWTKGFPYRTMNVNFNKDENGDKNTPVTVDLFEGRTARDGGELTDFKRFRLHSGGNSQVISWFGDAFTQRVAAEVKTVSNRSLDVATAGYRPVEVYLNGEYWGMYAIREHYSDVYIEQNYGVDKDDVIMLDKSPNVWYGNPGYYEDEKVFNTDFHFEVAEDDEDEQGMALGTQLFEFLYQNDLSNLNNYETFLSMVDAESLADLILVHLYGGNWDFMYNNIKMWRSSKVDPSNPYADGKWRFCLHDLDFSFESQWGDIGVNGANGYLSLNGQRAPAEEYLKPNTQYLTGNNYLDYYLGLVGRDGGNPLSYHDACLIASPMRSLTFQDLFKRRAEIVNEIYNADEALEILLEMEAEIEDVQPRHQARWNREGYGVTEWRNAVENTKNVLSTRAYLIDYFNDYDGGAMYEGGDYLMHQIRSALHRFNNV